MSMLTYETEVEGVSGWIAFFVSGILPIILIVALFVWLFS